MTSSKFETVLADLRSRVEAGFPALVPPHDADELSRALHDLDVCHAELEIQNQDLLNTQHALSLARDRYRALFDEALTPIFSVSEHGVVLDANRAALELCGRSRDRFVNRPFVVCLEEGEPHAYFQHLQATREIGTPQSVELRLRLPGGRTRTILLRSRPLSDGARGSLLCHASDLTDERAAIEAKLKLESRLHQAEKLEAVGRVAANIAHDVNNVLVSVISIAEFTQSQVAASSPIFHELEALTQAAWRGGRMLRGLLGLSRPSTRPHVAIDLRRVAERVVSMVRHSKPSVEVSFAGPGEPVNVDADEDEVLQALLNVATNALDATNTGHVKLGCDVTAGVLGLPVARLTVKDTGTGMDAGTLARAFEPLFTTKSDRGGSGLGLTLVHRTVENLRGSIEITSNPGQGTVVTIQLPLSRTVATTSVPPPMQAAASELRVLLVDDDSSTRAAVKRQLSIAGVEVRDFPDGPSAFAALEDGLAVDAAVVDVNMPVWTGPELVSRIFALRPRLPVVFITGAAGDLIPRAMLDEPHVRLLQKPWQRGELVGRLLTLTGAPDSPELQS